MKSHTPHGYIALISMLVISVVVTTIGMTSALTSVSEGQMGVTANNGNEARFFVESCAEDVLFRLRLHPTNLSSTNVLPEGTCAVSYIKNGNVWTVTITGTKYDISKTITFVADTTGQVILLNSWREGM